MSIDPADALESVLDVEKDDPPGPAQAAFHGLVPGTYTKVDGGVLFENRPALYFCNYRENKKNNIRMLDTLFIEDFIVSIEQYFHF